MVVGVSLDIGNAILPIFCFALSSALVLFHLEGKPAFPSMLIPHMAMSLIMASLGCVHPVRDDFFKKERQGRYAEALVELEEHKALEGSRSGC